MNIIGNIDIKMNTLLIKILIRSIFAYSLLLVMILGSAGRLDYWQGWALFGNHVLLGIINIILLKDKQELIKERMKPGKGMKWWDKIFFAFLIPLSVVIFVVGALDSGRFGWTVGFPVWLYVFGFIALNLSNVLVLWSMLANPFFSSVVRIQDDRGQRVIKTGPYGFVRHPGYTAIILGIFAVPVCFGSVYALIPAGVLTIAFIIRTYLEDKTLQKELDGYLDYTKEVKYRLFPLIW